MSSGIRARWVQNTHRILAVEPDLQLRHAHMVAYKALLADLMWEKVLTEDEMRKRRQTLEGVVRRARGH